MAALPPLTTPMFRYALSTCLFIALAGFAADSFGADDQAVDFHRDIRPLLSDACFHCHGPDEATQEAGLRLDLEDAAKEYAIVPGDPDASEVMQRILTRDPDLVMPPPNSGKSLTKDQIELFRRWIADGAPYETHWAFAPPIRPSVPEVDMPEWVQNPIDAFVAGRLQQEEMSPARRADTTTLVRRLYLDLIGLPPTPDQVDDYLRQSSNGYASLVDQLLDSPHYGERWARIWLDAARYADSNEDELKQQLPDWPDAVAAWEASVRVRRHEWEVLQPVKLPYEGTKFRVLDDFSILSESYAPKSAAPEFLFQPPASYGQKTWHEAKDGSRYRRALYTFRFRSVPYPMLEAFDATPGIVSCVRRTRSNTPLQSLTLMNEPLFVECARALAAKTLAEGGDDDVQRVVYAMRRCVSRKPTQQETKTLVDMLGKQQARIGDGQLDAEAIAGGGSSDEHAAWTLLARVLLNLDETITKE